MLYISPLYLIEVERERERETPFCVRESARVYVCRCHLFAVPIQQHVRACVCVCAPVQLVLRNKKVRLTTCCNWITIATTATALAHSINPTLMTLSL